MESKRNELIPTRWSLIKRLQNQGDAKSWEEFYHTYWRLIYGIAIKSGLTDAEAKDAAQETLITVNKNIGKLDARKEAGTFKGWLLKTTRWKIKNQFRKRRNDHLNGSLFNDSDSETDPLHGIPDVSGGCFDSLWESEWLQHTLGLALENVRRSANPRHYQIYHLHVVRETPANEVARKLGINVGLVYLAKCRIGALVRKEVERIESESL